MASRKNKFPSLATRIFFNIVLLFLLTVGMGLVTIWFAGRFNNMLQMVAGEGTALLQASRIMETELANQKGFVTYYFLDHDNKWLQELMTHRQRFGQYLEQALETPQPPEQMVLLKNIDQLYRDYVRGKDEVIEFYRDGVPEQGEALHWQVREKFFELNELCRQYRRLSEAHIQRMTAVSRASMKKIFLVTTGLVVVQFLLAGWLVFKLFSNVILPIRQLSRKAQSSETELGGRDEITVLRDSVYGLMDDMSRTREELQQSKEMLMHSEKMALVGKLAPVVAHSIRNPMTSINMRLFSLQRNLSLTDTQQEDFEVIFDEMRRLDHIVQNFLEFSRPHKLRKQVINISGIMEKTLALLSYRLDLYNISVSCQQEAEDIYVEADPELIKEVFVNLIVNACDAMENGGNIVIGINEMFAEDIGQSVMVSVTDTGPGISDEMQEKVLKPFETTKADGTGLGLFIAVKIIEEHSGTLNLTSEEGRGTTFNIMLPALREVKK